MAYKILGYITWRGIKWYATSRVEWVTSRKVLTAGLVGATVVGLAVAGSRRAQDG